MDITANVAYLAALSAASERLVEIIKGIPSLGLCKNPQVDGKDEAKRVAKIDSLSIGAGLITASIAYGIGVLPSTTWWAVVAYGFLAGAGSGFWNAILAYLLQVKDLKKAKMLGITD